MGNVVFETYVAVFFFDHPGENDPEIYSRFVTSTQGSTVLWEADKPAMKFSESYARDIAFGLTVNGWCAAVVKVVKGVQLRNPRSDDEADA